MAGAWWAIRDMVMSVAVACSHAADAGAIGLAIDELRLESPADWVSLARRPSGKAGVLFHIIGDILIYMGSTEDQMKVVGAASPNGNQLLDVYLDGLRAWEEAGALAEPNVMACTWLCFGLFIAQPALFALSETNRMTVRGAASSIRFAMNNSLAYLHDLGSTTSMWAVRDLSVQFHAASGRV